MVPTLSHKEVGDLIKADKPPESIVRKAIKHAAERMNNGKSPFKEEREVAPMDHTTEYEEESESRRRNVIIEMQRERGKSD